MSEEVKEAEVPEAPKLKQYLLVVDDITMAFLGKIMPGIRYIEVEGMHVAGNDKHQFLVNPLQLPQEPPAA